MHTSIEDKRVGRARLYKNEERFTISFLHHRVGDSVNSHLQSVDLIGACVAGSFDSLSSMFELGSGRKLEEVRNMRETIRGNF